MDVISDEIEVNNTHPSNQNGVSLGESGSETTKLKLERAAEERSVHDQVRLNQPQHQQTSVEQSRYSALNSTIFSQPQHLQPQKFLSMQEQNYVMTHGGTNQVCPTYAAQIRMPSISSPHNENSRMSRLFGMNTSEGFHISSSGQSFVTSSGYAVAPGYYSANTSTIDYTKGVSAAQPSFSSNNQYNQSNDFTIISLPCPPSSDHESRDQRSMENMSGTHNTRFIEPNLVSQDPPQSLQLKPEEASDSSDDEDVHQCGRCKQVFHTLNNYIAHKSSKVCKTSVKAAKPTSTSPVIPINNHNILEASAKNVMALNNTISEITPKTEINVNNQNSVESTSTKDNLSLNNPNILDTTMKNVLPIDNQDILDSTLKDVVPVNDASLLNTSIKNAISNQNVFVSSNSTSMNNQNILETAAKNTIFRDSFITLDDTSNMSVEVTVSHGILQRTPPRGEDDSDSKEKALSLSKMTKENNVEVVKRRRGRPPKSSYDVNHVQSGLGEDSPPKAKRKSRPPRRHKPDEDLSEVPLDVALEDESGGSMLFPNMDGTELPTVENIQKLFSIGRGRGRGRGKRRGPHPLHRCPICQLLFPSRLTMMEHKRKHTKVYRCKICNEGFYTEDKLEKHLSRETHNYPCDQCERILISKQALLRHKLSHSDKLHKCELCAKAFKTLRDLKNHTIGMHSETRDFVCQVCNKGFSRREKLKRHLMIHAPDRPVFTCPFKNHVGCDKTFYRKDKLTRHLYSHSKVKPFKCDQCEKSFARTDNLREHIRSHTGVFRYYCTVCGKGQPGPKKFLQHMLKQHNVENAEIPKPFDESAPEPLIQQHKAVVQAENAAKMARAASNMKKEREKSVHKIRKDDLDGQEMHVDPSHHVTLAAMNNLGIHAVNAPTLLSSPVSQAASSEQQNISQSRANIESLYSINQHSATSPQFQISRHIPEGMVRQISENILRENITRDGLNRDSALREGLSRENIAGQQNMARHLNDNGEVRLQENLNRHLVESPHLTSEALRRQINDANVAQPSREVQEQQQQQQQQQQQTLAQGMTVEAEGSIPVTTRGLQLLSHGVLPGNLQFTTLLNSDLVAIGEAVIRNQNGIPTMFQQKFGPTQ